MRHAGDETLDGLDDLLVEIRRHEGLREKKRGIFYLKSAAFLHFHEDPTGIFADLRSGSEWERFPVDTSADRTALLARLNLLLGAG